MPRFKTIVRETEAEQWFPEKQVPGVKRSPLQEGQERRYYVTTAHEQHVYLEPGDWITAEDNGRGYYPIKDVDFKKRYEPIEGGDLCSRSWQASSGQPAMPTPADGSGRMN